MRSRHFLTALVLTIVCWGAFMSPGQAVVYVETQPTDNQVPFIRQKQSGKWKKRLALRKVRKMEHKTHVGTDSKWGFGLGVGAAAMFFIALALSLSLVWPLSLIAIIITAVLGVIGSIFSIRALLAIRRAGGKQAYPKELRLAIVGTVLSLLAGGIPIGLFLFIFFLNVLG